MKTCDIYTLSDPRDGSVRYVGKSTQVEMRYYNHLDYAKRPGKKYKSTNWIRSLLALGLKPVLTVIETVPYEQWADRERHWITVHREAGADLTNHNDGGYGPWEVSPETSAKLSAATARRNAARKGQPASEHAKAAWSAAQKRRIAAMSPSERREYAQRMVRKRKPGWNRGWNMTDDAKARIGAANKAKAEQRKGLRLGALNKDLFGRVSTVDNGVRQHFDYFPTPRWMTESLLRFHPMIDGSVVLEPCAGDDAITSVLRERGCTVHTNDIDQRHPAETHFDASLEGYWLNAAPACDWIITNPPFNGAIWILQHAVRHARVGVAFLLRKTFLEPTEDRGPWLMENPPSRVIGQRRHSFRGVGSDSVSCDWMLWLREPDLSLPPIVIDHVAERRTR